jgi:hypothetical protein
MTASEALRFAARLVLPPGLSARALEARVADALEVVGLGHCGGTLVGGDGSCVARVDREGNGKGRAEPAVACVGCALEVGGLDHCGGTLVGGDGGWGVFRPFGDPPLPHTLSEWGIYALYS